MMAKLPAYLKVTESYVANNKLVVRVRVCWWHPGAWWMLLKVVWQWLW